MTDSNSNAGDDRGATPVHFWIVGVLALLWNFMGAFDYLATQLELDFYLSQFDAEMLAYVEAYPKWAVAGWAFGVWGAFAGSIGLLMRRKWSVWAFAVSLAGLVLNTIYTFGMSNGAEIFGTKGMIFTGAIWVVSIFLLWYSWSQEKNGVLV